MGKLKKELMAHTMDDMGEPRYTDEVFNDFFGSNPIKELDDLMESAGFEVAHKDWELGKYSTEQLQAELARRGYVNGVLVHPELDQ